MQKHFLSILSSTCKKLTLCFYIEMLYGVVLLNLSEFSLLVDNPKQLLVYSLLILKSAIHFAKNDFSV